MWAKQKESPLHYVSYFDGLLAICRTRAKLNRSFSLLGRLSDQNMNPGYLATGLCGLLHQGLHATGQRHPPTLLPQILKENGKMLEADCGLVEDAAPQLVPSLCSLLSTGYGTQCSGKARVYTVQCAQRAGYGYRACLLMICVESE